MSNSRTDHKRLIAISEATHAAANAGDKSARFLLKEANCNCKQCKRKKLLKDVIKESKWFCSMGRMCNNNEIVNNFRLRRRVIEHRLKKATCFSKI